MRTERGELRTNDGCVIRYEYGHSEFESPGDSPIVLVHGWSGSHRYFDHSFAGLLAEDPEHTAPSVLRYDLRGHGDSDKPYWGQHVSRHAADLRDVIAHLNLENATLVGTSLGCAIIWSYFELFGSSKVKTAIFVDQAPLQNRAEDWTLGSYGCYDIASLTRLQAVLKYDFAGFARANCTGCLATPIDPEYEQLLVAETMKASPTGLAALMADHTALDWRPLLPRIDAPCLVLVGGKSQIFPREGVLEVARLIPNAESVVFEEHDHWLYIEDSKRFNRLVSEFAATGTVTSTK